jgi:ubiquinol-cytochrome c reductase cytochrome b subunit
MKSGKKGFLQQIRWGEYSYVALAVSVLSGLVLALQYDPATPFYSVSAIDTLVPFGSFWRSLHFYSSQFFFLLTVCHFIFIYPLSRNLNWRKWSYLTGSLPVVLLLLFTGYVLRADATGESAGRIAENITLAIPLIGSWINSLLFSIDADGLKRVYVNHLIGLGLVWGILCWDHLRRYNLAWKESGIFVLLMIFVSVIFQAPMEPEKLGVFNISGPWFFLGLQELLHYIQPFWAGVIFPLTLITALFFLKSKKWAGRAVIFSCCWLGLYAILTGLALLRL